MSYTDTMRGRQVASAGPFGTSEQYVNSPDDPRTRPDAHPVHLEKVVVESSSPFCSVLFLFLIPYFQLRPIFSHATLYIAPNKEIQNKYKN